MIAQVLVVCLIAGVFPDTHCRPSVGRRNDEHGNFGYNYEVSHGSGSSRVHLDVGGKSRHPQAEGKHILDSSYGTPKGHSKPDPSTYQGEDNFKHSGSSPHGSRGIQHDPHPSYPAPYDSVAKKGLQEYIEEPQVSYNNPHHAGPSTKYVSSTGHGVYTDPSQSHQPNQYASQEYQQVPVQHSIPVESYPSNHAPVESYSGNHAPVESYSGNHDPVESYPGNHSPVTSYSGNHAPVESYSGNYAPVESYAQQPLPIYAQENVDDSKENTHLQQLPETQVPVESYGGPAGHSGIGVKPLPVQEVADQKYVFVPNGPPYVQVGHTAQIIHGPAPNGPAVPVAVPVHHPVGGPVHPSVQHPVSGPGPVSHSIPLPLSVHNPVVADPIVPEVSLESHDDIAPLSPISHSTRLLLPSPHGVISKPISDPIIDAADGFSDVHDGLLDFTAEDSSLGGDLTSGVNHIPPVSHAFRLSFPKLSPVAEVRSNGELSSLDETHDVPSAVIVDPVPPVSHAFRLSFPPFPSVSSSPQDLPVPKIDDNSFDHDEDISELADLSLLALETKSD